MAADTDKLKKFVMIVMSAISNSSLYSNEHASVEELTQKAISILDELLAVDESIEIMTVKNNLIINKVPLKDEGIHGKNFSKRLKRKGLSRVDFLHGVNIHEVKQFVSDMSDPEKGIRTYPHIRTGTIEIRTHGLQMGDSFDIESITSLASEQVKRVKEVYSDISPFKQLNIAGLEDIVINFIVTFKREAGILHLISPVKSYSEFTYTHATNVAVLSLFQAEALGLKDELLHNIGIAALLHDVGKLFISKEILEKKGELNDTEWEEIRRHTLYGAKYLAKIDDLTHIAPIVSFEHHLRFDGKGYPKVNGNMKKQHICSQIIEISDFFDALRSRRPYKRAWETKEILALLKKNAGIEFNPFLVDNFIRIITVALNVT